MPEIRTSDEGHGPRMSVSSLSDVTVMGYEEFQAGARHNSTTLYDTSMAAPQGAKRTSIGKSDIPSFSPRHQPT